MKNWKTTLAGLFGALGPFAPALGLPAEVGQAISVLGIFLLGLFSGDAKKVA